MNFPKRSHTCGALRIEDDGSSVALNGWIDSRRDLGKLIFLDLRDRYGITQVVLDTTDSPELMQSAHDLRPEFVLAVQGQVRPRPGDARNPDKPTGDIEVLAEKFQVLNASKTPPFEISEEIKVSDELRMRYRYLDIRKPGMQHNLTLRHEILLALRNALSAEGFIEVETPLLTKSTPEGARDFLVPSRTQAGSFYALPQSPQLFKQLLMVGGMDKYFQVVRCLRDEDLRADRQPEFTQLDLEMSFVEEEDIYNVLEKVMVKVLVAAGKDPLPLPFPRITYQEAMTRYGSDKPDLRFGMEFFDLHDVAASCGFKVFKSVADSGGAVIGITAKGCSKYSRKDIDGLTGFVQERGAKGLAWLKLGEEGFTSPIAKFFSPEELAKIQQETKAEPGDLILIIAAPLKVARLALGELRLGRLFLEGNAQIIQKFFFDAGRRTGEQAHSGCGLGKGDHFAEIIASQQEHYHSIDAQGNTRVRRCTVFKGIQQETEFLLRFLLVNAQYAENPGLESPVMYSHGTAAELNPVHHEIVSPGIE